MELYRPFPLAEVRELEDLLHERETASATEAAETRERRSRRVGELLTELTSYRAPHRGDVVAGARLEQHIGAGEFGQVWRGVRLDNDSSCAVKVFHAHRLGQGRMIREFRQGVAAMRALSASNPPPSIVRLLEADDSQLAFAMSLVEGSDLRDVAERGWTVAKKIELFTTLCEAVDFAHRHRVIHRDLKPANIVVDPQGHPVLTDFDLADLLTLGTLTGRSAGSLAYAAPEQVDPQLARSHGSRLVESDVYSLGRILFFLVVERDPPIFHRSTELQELALDEGLRRIARRCTLDDPRRRYANVGALLSDLRRYATEPASVGCDAEEAPTAHNLSAVPPRDPTEPKPGRMRHPLWVGVPVAAITLLGTLGAALINKQSTASSPVVASAVASATPTVSAGPTQGVSPGQVSPPVSAIPPAPASSLASASALSGPASLRRQAWLSRGVGSHSRTGENQPLREGKLALEPDEVQIGSFLCKLQFDQRGDPSLAIECQGRGPARTSEPLTLPLRCTEADDRLWVNCWSDEFQYSTGSKHRTGLFSLTLRLR